jgi:hypothetical protein
MRGKRRLRCALNTARHQDFAGYALHLDGEGQHCSALDSPTELGSFPPSGGRGGGGSV